MVQNSCHLMLLFTLFLEIHMFILIQELKKKMNFLSILDFYLFNSFAMPQ